MRKWVPLIDIKLYNSIKSYTAQQFPHIEGNRWSSLLIHVLTARQTKCEPNWAITVVKYMYIAPINAWETIMLSVRHGRGRVLTGCRREILRGTLPFNYGNQNLDVLLRSRSAPQPQSTLKTRKLFENKHKPCLGYAILSRHLYCQLYQGKAPATKSRTVWINAVDRTRLNDECGVNIPDEEKRDERTLEVNFLSIDSLTSHGEKLRAKRNWC